MQLFNNSNSFIIMRDNGRIKVFLKDPNKKSVLTILKEVLHLCVIKKEIPFYYFKHLYRKNIKNYKDYLGTKEGKIIRNKLAFGNYFESVAIPTPKLLCFNNKNIFEFKDKVTSVNSKEDIVKFYKDVFKSTGNTEMFIRPLSLQGGQDCFKLNLDDCDLKIDTYYNHLIFGSFVCSEVIKQHPEINKIYDKSINTIRILSFIDKEGNVMLISAAMRFGMGGSVVDNGSSGGFYVGVNLETGTLNNKGLQFNEHGGAEPTKHTDTDYVFGGFKIPFFNESCKLIKKALEHLPTGFAGWDVAITPNGPTLIEANENPHLHLSDSAYGGLLKNPHIKQLIDDLKKGYYSN